MPVCESWRIKCRVLWIMICSQQMAHFMRKGVVVQTSALDGEKGSFPARQNLLGQSACGSARMCIDDHHHYVGSLAFPRHVQQPEGALPALCDVIERLIKRGFAVSRKCVGRRLQLQFDTTCCKAGIGLDHCSPDLLDCRIQPICQGTGRKAVRHPNHIATFTIPPRRQFLKEGLERAGLVAGPSHRHARPVERGANHALPVDRRPACNARTHG